jgi:hypothetical protein
MRPVAAQRIGIEVERPGLSHRVSRHRRVGDEPVDVHVAIEVAEIEAGDIAMAGDETGAQEVEPGLNAEQLTLGARIREGLVAVVDLLADNAGPGRAAQTLVFRAGIFNSERVADPLVQRAERSQAQLSGDRLDHAVSRQPWPDDRVDPGR